MILIFKKCIQKYKKEGINRNEGIKKKGAMEVKTIY